MLFGLFDRPEARLSQFYCFNEYSYENIIKVYQMLSSSRAVNHVGEITCDLIVWGEIQYNPNREGVQSVLDWLKS